MPDYLFEYTHTNPDFVVEDIQHLMQKFKITFDQAIAVMALCMSGDKNSE